MDLDTGERIRLKHGRQVHYSHTTDWMGLQERRFAWSLKKGKYKDQGGSKQ